MNDTTHTMTLPHGQVPLPAFFPDGTRGVVRCLDAVDLTHCGVQGLVMNTYHLLSQPGASTLKSMGGLHRFTGWNRPIVTDSGGFQVFSLIRENGALGEIRPNEIIFRNNGKKTVLTPKKCITAQFSYGADIMMCLDYCTHPNDSPQIQRKSVDTTVRWAQKCADTYQQLWTSRGKGQERPLLFGIIQGGGDRALRKACAQALIAMGFDGFGFGGWPLDSEGRLTEDILAYTAELMPAHTIKYAMGLGRPESVVVCYRMGYQLFDCVIPTREARHHRLYVFNEEYASPADIDPYAPRFYAHYYILDDEYRRDARPVSAVCDCYCCTHYSRAYLRHLNSIGDALGSRLATMHNLRFYTMLMEALRAKRHG